MRVTTISIKEFSESMQQDWAGIQLLNPALAGPCFSPELYAAVGRSCPDVHVAIIHDEKKPVGFLPFLKDRRSGIAKPVPLCDYQAIIAPEGLRLDAERILKEAGLRAWDFEHLVGFENIISKGRYLQRESSFRIDLKDGFEKYLTSSGKGGLSGSGILRNQSYIEKIAGKIRYVPVCNDIKVLHKIIDWKSARYNKDLSFPSWIKGALENIYYMKKEGFSGALSGLYAGDELIAAHFGMYYQGIFYYWFPAFNPDYAKHSPGNILLYHILAGLSLFKCSILDFGPGGEQYKKQFSNGSISIVRGSVELPSAFTLSRRCKRAIKSKIRSIDWLYGGLKRLLK